MLRQARHEDTAFVAAPSKINLILSLSKDEAAPVVAAAIEQVRRPMSDSRFLQSLGAGAGLSSSAARPAPAFAPCEPERSDPSAPSARRARSASRRSSTLRAAAGLLPCERRSRNCRDMVWVR